MTTVTDPRDPYVNEALDEVYFRRSALSFNEARHLAAQHAAETIGNWGRTRYKGFTDLRLHDHEEPWDDVTCDLVDVWVFTTYEGTYRS